MLYLDEHISLPCAATGKSSLQLEMIVSYLLFASLALRTVGLSVTAGVRVTTFHCRVLEERSQERGWTGSHTWTTTVSKKRYNNGLAVLWKGQEWG